MLTLLAVVGAFWVLDRLVPSHKAKINVPADQNAVYPSQYNDIISHASKRFGLAKSLIGAIIWTESRNNAQAIGDGGASFGLMQIQCRTARDMEFQGSCSELQTPPRSVFYGSKYLKSRIDKYGLENGVLSYNTGSPTRKGQLFDPNNYRYKVFSAYKKFQQEGRG